MSKANDNLTRLIQLAEDSFHIQDDPDQIGVDERVLNRLMRIHPSSVAEESTRNGPVAWMLILPTTHRLMELFVSKQISEKELLKRTHAGMKYDAAYLCSALVLPEYQRKGIARRLSVRAIKAMMKDHPIAHLFYWPFSPGGEKLAERIASDLHLPLQTRPR